MREAFEAVCFLIVSGMIIIAVICFGITAFRLLTGKVKWKDL